MVSPQRKAFTLKARHFRLSLGKKTKVMGILNLTPDSFSGDGYFKQTQRAPEDILPLAQRMVRDGADIIDVGGESTRPGAKQISPHEEIKRILPIVRLLVKNIKVPLSIDTYKPQVARHALDAGASIVNNILGTRPDDRLLRMVKKYDAALVLMHIRGNPRTMQKNISYHNLIAEMITELHHAIEKCLEIGIKTDKIIVDPGIGFSKTAGHNLNIIARLRDFEILGHPILVGTSRKSFIGKVLNRDMPQRLMGTASSVCAAILNGAHVVRVHDVKEMRDVADMADAILNQAQSGI